MHSVLSSKLELERTDSSIYRVCRRHQKLLDDPIFLDCWKQLCCSVFFSLLKLEPVVRGHNLHGLQVSAFRFTMGIVTVDVMSTSDLRERLRKLAERTAKELQDSQRKREQGDQSVQSNGDKENSVLTAPTNTNTRMTRTAPTKLLKNTNMVETPSIPELAMQNSSLKPNTLNINAISTVPCTSTSDNAEIRTSFSTPIESIIAASKSSDQIEKVGESITRNNRSITRSVEREKKRTTSAHTEQSTGSKGDNVAMAVYPLRRSESASGSRSNRYIYVNNHPYVVIDLLGKGGSSEVYQVLDERQKKLRAVKCVDLSEADYSCRSAYLNEIKLLLSLKDTGCVVEMSDYELHGDFLYVVMEKGDTDLATFLKTRRNQIDDIFIRFYWSEMLKCVHTIHEKGIVHSDLKPANFLLVGGNLKLIDFGIASAIPTNKTSVIKDTQMGTLSYMPPEAIASSNVSAHNGKEIYKVRKKCDVWALGCILYNMVYGHTPYQMWTNPVQKMHAILNKPIVFEKIEDADLMDVLKRCLTRDPDQRSTVEELQKHPYLTRRVRKCMDESILPQDDKDLMKVAEDLRNSTPRTSARKLRDLMQRQNTKATRKDLVTSKFT
ncbi:Dual specificity protein kinase Ttk [Dirofilaria immitis]|nr:Dual specificity protein kinase Ttk [Dirofilaria immitis]